MAHNRNINFISEENKVVIRFWLFFLFLKLINFNDKSETTQCMTLIGSLFFFFYDAYITNLDMQENRIERGRLLHEELKPGVVNALSESNDKKDKQRKNTYLTTEAPHKPPKNRLSNNMFKSNSRDPSVSEDVVRSKKRNRH